LKIEEHRGQRIRFGVAPFPVTVKVKWQEGQVHLSVRMVKSPLLEQNLG